MLKIRLQSRRKMDNSSPMNRLSTKLGHNNNRSCARSSTVLKTVEDVGLAGFGGEEFELVESDKAADSNNNCDGCNNANASPDDGVIVVRTK